MKTHKPSFTSLWIVPACLLSLRTVFANPAGGTVTSGSANIKNTSSDTLTITQSTQSAIINWTSFNIDAGETTRFVLPDSAAVTLNRVTSLDPSKILGTLQSNGTLLLVNPNGVFFGPHSVIDVASLVATTSGLGDADFLAGVYTGKYHFDTGSTRPGAAVINEGTISIADHGLAALVGPSVRNSGTITARLGTVDLGIANDYTLDFWGDGLLSFGAGSAVAAAAPASPGAPAQALITNTGQIIANGGTVQLSADTVASVVSQAIDTSGIIEARSVGASNGHIVLSGGATGTVTVSGLLDVSTTAPAVTTAAASAGSVNADSEGAGAISVTGQAAVITPTGVLDADAVTQGHGGSILVMSDSATDFAGTASAHGGSRAGNGGTIEISSHGNLSLTGTVDLSAPHGATGDLLLDPATLEITDSSDTTGGGSGSTVTRGWLENVAGSGNVTLQATGQITVDSMAGGLIDLATTTGSTFTLESTQSGGIQFLNPTTQLRTAGGNITLEAPGLASTLTDIGPLTSNGGNITLSAGQNITLAGAINAGTGTVSLSSTGGSIQDVGGNSAVLTGTAISVAAAQNSLGTAAQPLLTNTANLTLLTGGNLYVTNSLALTNLAATADHPASQPGSTYGYQLTSPGLTFAVNDGSSLTVGDVEQAGLDLQFTTDSSLNAGTVNVGTGSMTLTSSGGSINGTAGTALTAAAITLDAPAAGASIGTASFPILTTTPALSSAVASGGMVVSNTGPLSLSGVSAAGPVTVSTTGNLTVGQISASGQTTTLQSGGSVLNDSDTSTTLTTQSLGITAQGSIGTSTIPLVSSANTINTLNAASGGIFVWLGNGLYQNITLNSVISGNGPISLTTDARPGNSTYANSLISSTDSAANTIQLTVDTGNLYPGTLNAGTMGNITLTTLDTKNSTVSQNGGSVTGNVLTVSTQSPGSVNLQTAANTLDVSAGSGITINQYGNVSLAQLVTSTGSVSLTTNSAGSSPGTVTLEGPVTAGNLVTLGGTNGAGTVSMTTQGTAASIFADPDATDTDISGSSITLTANDGALGSNAGHLLTITPNLTLLSAGDLVVNNGVPLLNLTITNNHGGGASGNGTGSGGAGNLLLLTSPYLTFTATDNGSATTLGELEDETLNTLSYTTDQTLIAGNIKAGAASAQTGANVASSTTLHTTGGDILDDGDANTRVTGATVTLTADNGGIGVLGDPVGVNAVNATLNLNTGGNLFVSDITDVTNLTINSHHTDGNANYGYLVTAPSLTWDVTDSSAGYAFNTLTDLDGFSNTLPSLNFTFSGDRSLTLGAIDITRTGTLSLTSTGGSILDDGNGATRAIANSITLLAQNGSLGTSTDPLQISAATLRATSQAGGVFIDLPMSADSGIYDPVSYANGSLTEVYADANGGPVVVDAQQGDLLIDEVYANGNAITLSADQGSILDTTNTYLRDASAITLSAAGLIGTTTNPLRIHDNTGTINATAGNGGIALEDVSSNNGLTVGTLDAGASPVWLYSQYGGIHDDGNTSTVITGSTVTLQAIQNNQGLGTLANPLNVVTTNLSTTTDGSVYITDTASLATLALNSTNSNDGLAYLITAPNLTTSLTASQSGGLFTLGAFTANTALPVSLAGNRSIALGNLDTTGSLNITTTGGSITRSGTSTLTAPTVTLQTASGSIGAAGAGNAITLSGTTNLTLAGSGDFYVADASALTSLSVASADSNQTADNFVISAPGDTFNITDNGNYVQSLGTISGTGLANFSFSSYKNLQIGTIAATGTVTLASENLDNNGNPQGLYYGSQISQGAGTGITAGAVSLTSNSSYYDNSGIGNNGSAIQLATSSLTLSTAGSLYVNDSTPLSQLAITTTHPVSSHNNCCTYLGLAQYSIVDSSANESFSITENTATDAVYGRNARVTTVNVGTSNGLDLDFSLTTDNLIAAGTINVGTGAVVLDSTGALDNPYGGAAPGAIIGASGSNQITAGSVNLEAPGYYSYIGTSSAATSGHAGAGAAAVNVNTPVLTIGSGSSAYVNDSASLTALTLNDLINIDGGGANYGITATNLLTSSMGAGGSTLTINSFTTASNLALTVNTNDNLSVGTLSTGVSGQVVLNAQGGISVSNVTTGGLTLTGTAISGATTVANLTATATSGDSNGCCSTISLSNTGDELLHAITAASSISLTSSGNFTADGSSTIVAPTVTLTAAGAMGTSTVALNTNARVLTVANGSDFYIANQSDLFALTLSSTHTIGGHANTTELTSPQLTFDVTDSGSQYSLANVSAANGMDFTFTGDNPAQVGTVDTQYGHRLTLQVNSGALTVDTANLNGDNANPLLTAGLLTLTAPGAIGSSGTHFNASALALNLNIGSNLYLDDGLDLSSLAITTTQNTASTASWVLTSGPAFNSTTPTLTFTGNSDNGSATVLNTVIDTTGLNFTVNAADPIEVGTIALTPINAWDDLTLGLESAGGPGAGGLASAGQTGGALSLTSAYGISVVNSGNQVSAATATLTTGNGADIGAAGAALHISVPLLTVNANGGLYISSADTNIDSLDLNLTHDGNAQNTYELTTPDQNLAAHDSGTQLDLESLSASSPMNAFINDDIGFLITHVNLQDGSGPGSGGSLGLNTTAPASSITAQTPGNDASATTPLVSTASLYLHATGAIGAVNDPLTTQVDTLNAYADGGGVFLDAVTGPAIGSIAAHGNVVIDLPTGAGDIALGTISLNDNGLTVDNEGGSVVSGAINGLTDLALTAQGSIGNGSALSTSAATSAGTTLTATAYTNTRGATGSVNLSEAGNLVADSVTAPGGIALSAGGSVQFGTLQGGSSAVSLTSTGGNAIFGTDTGNSVTGSSVTLSTSGAIGVSATPINVTTPILTVSSSNSDYVADTAALSQLTLTRAGGSGTVAITAANGFAPTITDTGGQLNITGIDQNGLDLTVNSHDSISVGTIDVGGTGSAYLNATYNGNAAIWSSNPTSLLTAGTLTVLAGDGGLGTASQFLQIAAGSLTAQAGANGTYLSQAGDLALSSFNQYNNGGLHLTTTNGGNILVDANAQATYTSNGGVVLNAAGSILAGGGVLDDADWSNTSESSYDPISLTAVNGIGTAVSPVQINAYGGNNCCRYLGQMNTNGNNYNYYENWYFGAPVSATVSGTGNIYLNSQAMLPGGLTTSAANGATVVTSNSDIVLTQMTSATDALGNDISVTTSSGNILYNQLSAGATAGRIVLTDTGTGINSQILAVPGYSITASGIELESPAGIGVSTSKGNGGTLGSNSFGGLGGLMYWTEDSYGYVPQVNNQLTLGSSGIIIVTQDVPVNLTTSAPAILSRVSTSGAAITVTGTGDLQLLNLASGGTTISVTDSGSVITAGNVTAGAGSVSLSAASILDDGTATTQISGASVSLTTTSGIGTATDLVQADTQNLTPVVSGTGSLYLDNAWSTGWTLPTLTLSNGAADIESAGPMVAGSITLSTDTIGNNLTLTTDSGNLTIGTLSAGTTHGQVSLTATNGGIVADGVATTNVIADAVTLSGSGGVGTLTNATTGAGAPIVLAVTEVNGLSSSAANSNINVSTTGSLIFAADPISQPDTGTTYIKATQDIDTSAGLTLGADSVTLNAGATLILPATFTSAGALTLLGGTDITSANTTSSRTLTGSANSLYLRSDSAGGDTTLDTTTDSLNVALTGSSAADLTVSNTSALTALTLATTDGDVTLANSAGIAGTSITAGGTAPTVSVTAATGSVGALTLDAGSAGTIDVTAAAAAITNLGTLTAAQLNLSAADGIGSAGSPLLLTAPSVSTTVTGTGSVNAAWVGALTLTGATTHSGDIVLTGCASVSDCVASANTLSATGTIAAGGSGAVTLAAHSVGVETVTSGAAQTYTGATTFDGDLTAGSIQVNGDTTLAAQDMTFDTSTSNGAIDFTGTLAGANHALALTAGTGTVTLAAAASGLASLGIDAGNISLGNVTTRGLQQYTGDLVLAGTYTSTGGGSFSANGATTLAADTTIQSNGGAVTFSAALDGDHTLDIEAGSGAIDLSGTTGGSVPLGAVTLNSSDVTQLSGNSMHAASLQVGGDGSVVLAGTGITTQTTQDYTDAATISADTTLTGTQITFGSTVNAATPGGAALTVTGNAEFQAAVGGNTTLAALSVSGQASLNGGVVSTAGDQTYAGAATLGADTSLHGTTVSFGGALDGTNAGGETLSISGAGSFAAPVGSSVSLAALSISGTTALNTTSITTTGTQTFGAATTVGTNSTLTGSVLQFDGPVDGAGVGQQNLVLVGTAVINDAVGAVDPLHSLSVTGSAVLSSPGVTTTDGQIWSGPITLDAGSVFANQAGDLQIDSTIDGAHPFTVQTAAGSATFAAAVGAATALQSLNTTGAGIVHLDGGSVTTTGAQTYDAPTILGTDAVLTGSLITFNNTLDAAAPGAQSVRIAGDADISAAAGGNQSLAALTVTGATTLSADITTTDAQLYEGPITLTADPVMTTDNSPVTFDSSVEGPESLTVTTGTGDISFLGAVGDVARLGALATVSTGATLFAGPVSAASLIAGAGAVGTLQLNGGSVDTTGTQTYNEAVLLGADTTLKAPSAIFNASLDGAGAGAQSLTVLGNVLFASQVGASTALQSIDVNGSATINGGRVFTTSTQSYGDGATLGADATLTGSLVTFTGALNGTTSGDQGLQVLGDAAFDGAAGAVHALRTLSVSGTTALSGASLDTQGTQTFDGAVTVTGEDSLVSAAGDLALLSTVDGSASSALTLSAAAGDVHIAGIVGGNSSPGELDVTAAQHLAFDAAVTTGSLEVTVSGTPTFSGPIKATAAGGMTFNGDQFHFVAPLTATTGAITFNLDSGGSLVFDESAPLQSATGVTENQIGSTTITLGSDITVQQGGISFQGSPQLAGNALNFKTNGLIAFTGLNGTSTDLTLNAGSSGNILIGTAGATDAAHQALLQSLTVAAGGTGKAQLFGTLAGKSGAEAASKVDSPLVGAPYYYNGVPWGPSTAVGTAVAITQPQSPVIAAPGAADDSLPVGTDPGILQPRRSPHLLQIASQAIPCADPARHRTRPDSTAAAAKCHAARYCCIFPDNLTGLPTMHGHLRSD